MNKEQIIEIDFEKVMKRIENLSCFEDLSEDEIQEILDLVVDIAWKSSGDIPILFIHGEADSHSYRFSRKHLPDIEVEINKSKVYSMIHSCPVCGNPQLDEEPNIGDIQSCDWCGSTYTVDSIDQNRIERINGIEYHFVYEMSVLEDKNK